MLLVGVWESAAALLVYHVTIFPTQPRSGRKDDEARGRVAAPHGHELEGVVSGAARVGRVR